MASDLDYCKGRCSRVKFLLARDKLFASENIDINPGFHKLTDHRLVSYAQLPAMRYDIQI